MPKVPELVGHRRLKVLHVQSTVVGQAMPFQVSPHSLRRIELRGVGRQWLNLEVGDSGQESPDLNPPMNTAPVPEHGQPAAHMPAKILQESHGALLANLRVSVQVQVRPQAAPLRRERQRPDARHFPLVPLGVPQHRRLSARRPGATNRRRQTEPRLVGPGEGGASAGGVFFILGHSCFTHRWILASSRSAARFSGFWLEKPNDVRNFHREFTW